MKKISLWAKHHKKPARLLIVSSFILLTLLGILTGSLLNEIGVSFLPLFLVVVIGIYLAALAIYPSMMLKSKKINRAVLYARQKCCDFALGASTFCMIVFFANQPGQLFNSVTPAWAANPVQPLLPKDSTLKTYKTIAAFSASLKDDNGKSLKWKERKKLLKVQVKAIRNSEMSKGGKTALIILSVLVAIGLLALVAALACNLSCSGSEGAAVMVMLGGGALIIYLLVITIKSIKGKKQKDTEVKPDDPGL